MTDRPIVRITVDDIHDHIDRVQVWSGGQWEDQPFEIQQMKYCWCGHSEGGHIEGGCLGCMDDGCDETCEHSSFHEFREVVQEYPNQMEYGE